MIWPNMDTIFNDPISERPLKTQAEEIINKVKNYLLTDRQAKFSIIAN